jgi:hypothetical protein
MSEQAIDSFWRVDTMTPRDVFAMSTHHKPMPRSRSSAGSGSLGVR